MGFKPIFNVKDAANGSTRLCHLQHLVASYHYFFFFFNVPATTEIYTLSLHDALPISDGALVVPLMTPAGCVGSLALELERDVEDRKSTRLNSSHITISYAAFCSK